MSQITRRMFLKASGIAATSLLIGCSRSDIHVWQRQDIQNGGGAFDAWLAITPEGRILVHSHKVEMGQGTYTAFATLVGEELRTDPMRIELIAAGVNDAFGAMQVTGGSSSLTEIWEPLRTSAATAREMLRTAAAERWGVSVAATVIEQGVVRDTTSDRAVSFGELAAAAAALPAPKDVMLTPPDQWRFIGKNAARVDAFAKSCGQARYGLDAVIPDLLTAVVVHCPHSQGRLVTFDDSAARGVAGVKDVFVLEQSIAIVAQSYWSARQAAGKLQVTWDPGVSRGVDTAFIRTGLTRALDSGELHSARNDGNVPESFTQASQVIEAEYSLPYLAHATMEPMNCTVVPRETGCDVYCGSQAPGLIQDAVAHELGLKRDAVAVHNQLLGGGFGRRVFTDAATEAAQIAHRTGRPIKVVWSREDDMARDYYRPPSVHRFRASLDGTGTPLGWEHKLAAPSLMPYMSSMAPGIAPQWMRGAVETVAGGLMARLPGWLGPSGATEGATGIPYAIPNVSVDAVAWDPGIPVGIWRSVAHSHNGFVVESFIDELAHAAGADPATYRRSLLSAHPRHLGVLDLLIDKANWGKPKAGLSQGMAIHESFGTVVGEVAEVSMEGGRPRVHRVICVVDCGLVVNPDIVASQMESGINFGLSAALYGAVNFKDGAAVESNFHDHPMLRMAEAPEIEVHFVPGSSAPSGVGEPGTPPVAAAVANAIFTATGRRIRDLPLVPA